MQKNELVQKTSFFSNSQIFFTFFRIGGAPSRDTLCNHLCATLCATCHAEKGSESDQFQFGHFFVPIRFTRTPGKDRTACQNGSQGTLKRLRRSPIGIISVQIFGDIAVHLVKKSMIMKGIVASSVFLCLVSVNVVFAKPGGYTAATDYVSNTVADEKWADAKRAGTSKLLI